MSHDYAELIARLRSIQSPHCQHAADAIEALVAERDKREWNPLTDDGDAFRLAVKLDLLVDGLAGNYDETQEEYDADPYAANRRAIVRAAAARLGEG
jgi:hypothetical protein